MPIISGGGGSGSGGTTPTYIGYNTIGASFEAVGAASATVFYKQVTGVAAGTIRSVDAHIKGNAANVSNFGAYVFDDNAGAPGKVVGGYSAGQTSGAINVFQVGLSATARWVAVPVNYYNPSANATLWLVFVVGDGASIAFDAGSDKKFAGGNTWIREFTDVIAATANSYSIRGALG